MSAYEDVEPIPQDDGPNPVVPIAYPAEYSRLMGFFRAFLKSGERSPRVLDLTADLLEHNAAHYTVWHVRRQCLFALAAADDANVLGDELDYAAEVATQNPKNYQIWYHRRALVEKLGAAFAAPELKFIAFALRGDAKNYHAWSHRLWVLRTYNDWGNELAYVATLHDDDVYNNSAWNHRHAVVAATTGPLDDETAGREVAYALARLPGAEENESAWVYATAFASRNAAAAETLAAFCEDALETAAWAKTSACLRAALVDLYAPKDAARAAACATALADDLDVPRAKYWRHKARTLEAAAAAA